jgi:hypothetical protein
MRGGRGEMEGNEEPRFEARRSNINAPILPELPDVILPITSHFLIHPLWSSTPTTEPLRCARRRETAEILYSTVQLGERGRHSLLNPVHSPADHAAFHRSPIGAPHSLVPLSDSRDVV